MTTVQNVLDFMETVAPLACKMDWDHVGLSCGSPSQSVRKILVASTPLSMCATRHPRWARIC